MGDTDTCSISPLNRVEDKDETTVYHVPFIPWHIIHHIWNGRMLLNTDALEEGLLPEAPTTFYGGNGEDDT